MSPSEWYFGVISDVASGIITRKWRVGFKWRKGSVEAFSGERGPNGERETRGVFWRTGFTMAITSYRQATGVQNGEWGSLFGKQMSGFSCGDPGSFAQKKIFVRGSRKRKRGNHQKVSGFKKSKKG
jgi:hypothetical protein